jgi:hypothetical protein
VWDEDSGALHRELERFGDVTAMVTFPLADGQQTRLVISVDPGTLRAYDPEAGAVTHAFEGGVHRVSDLACIERPSAPPHHPRVVSASLLGMAKVWDGW